MLNLGKPSTKQLNFSAEPSYVTYNHHKYTIELHLHMVIFVTSWGCQCHPSHTTHVELVYMGYCFVMKGGPYATRW